MSAGRGEQSAHSAARELRTVHSLDAREIRERVLRAVQQVADSDDSATYDCAVVDGDRRMQTAQALTAPMAERLQRFLEEQRGGLLDFSKSPLRERRMFLEDAVTFPSREHMERLPTFQQVLRPTGLVHQTRLLVFHGDRFVANLAALRRAAPFTARDRARLRVLVPAVSAALILAEGLERRTLPEGPADLVVAPDGRVELASAAGRGWLEREPFRRALQAHVRALDRGEVVPRVAVLDLAVASVMRLDGAPGVRYLVHVERPRPLVAPLALSPRQLDVARRAADGATLEEIARDVGASRETVKSHLREVYRRLEVSSRLELARALERALAARPR